MASSLRFTVDVPYDKRKLSGALKSLGAMSPTRRGVEGSSMVGAKRNVRTRTVPKPKSQRTIWFLFIQKAGVMAGDSILLVTLDILRKFFAAPILRFPL